MKISIITVCYNSAATICDAIKSVLEQTYRDIEYLIVDGGSTDGTVEVIKNYEIRIKNGEFSNVSFRWISEADDGIYDAMNKGIGMATGDVVGILNSDDIYQDELVLEDVVRQFEGKGIDTMYGNIEFVQQGDLDNSVRIWKSSEFKAVSFRYGWHPPHPSFFVRKHVYEKFGMFDTQLKVSADFELMLRLLEKHHVSTFYYDRFIVKMRIGGESTGSLRKIITGNMNVIKAFRKNGISVPFLYPIFRLLPKIKQFVFNKH